MEYFKFGMEEKWKDVPGYEGLYQVSSLGRVKSLPRNGTILSPRILKHRIHKNGYATVCLYKNNNIQEKLVHRIVAETFLENSVNYPIVNHIDGNKNNNSINNLEWCDFSYNTKHAFLNGLMKPQYEVLRKNASKKAKSVIQIDKNTKKPIRVWKSMSSAEKALNISTKINEVCSGKRKTAGGYIWKLKEEQ